MAFSQQKQQPTRCKNLVLDAGPLLSLSPLRGLAGKYYTVPQVLAELKDNRAREHFERLGLQAGVRIEVRSPDAASLAHVIQFAKKTGDYAVLSHVDLSLLALTYALHEQAKGEEDKKSEEIPDTNNIPGSSTASAESAIEDVSSALGTISMDEKREISEPENMEDSSAIDGIMKQTSVSGEEDVPLESYNGGQPHLSDVVTQEDESATPSDPSHALDPPVTEINPIIDTSENSDANIEPLYEDPSDSDDGEGEWITPSNVALHKSQALELLPNANAKSKAKAETIVNVGCMTADFAMQNVLLQMGLALVSVEGKRIERLKTWVLRCHACFKICKDPSKKFCPSCGNPSLLRTSVTISAPEASGDKPSMQIHLKKNFQYKNRGTVYSIPDPKPGSAKTGSGEGLILREDQLEYVRAKKRADAKKEREERKMIKGLFSQGNEHGVGVGNWMDPDWIPEMMSVGAGGKGRRLRSGTGDEMPVIGYGRKNPNERSRRK